MTEKFDDLATVPNGLTLARLAASPFFANNMRKDPRRWTVPSALLMASDIVDGIFARLGDTSPSLAKAGFRRSEFGRNADPFVDKVVGSEMLAAGMANGAIPKSLGALALLQKAAISVFVAKTTSEGKEIHVTKLGKRSETGINLGFGSFMLAESIDHPELKRWARFGAGTVAVASLIGAVGANIQYWAQTNEELAQVVPLSTETVELPVTE